MHRLGWACVLCPSQVQAAQVTRCVESTHSPGVCVLLPPLSQLLGFLGVQQEHHPKWGLRFMHFPGLSHSGSASRVIHKGTDSAVHVFCALPRSKQLSRAGAWQEPFPQVGIVSYHLHGPSPSISWVCSRHAFSVVACVSSGELISGYDPPGGCGLSRIPRSLG